MLVKIGPFRNHVGPWSVVDPLQNLLRLSDPVAERLADRISPLFDLLDRMRPRRRVKIRIDSYDTWSMDGTLAMIIVPMLRQLKATKPGPPMDYMVDIDAEHHGGRQKVFGFIDQDAEFEASIRKWDADLNEMIWAFEQVNEEWRSQFHKKLGRYSRRPVPDSDCVELICEEEPEIDFAGMTRHQERMNRGFVLFGKHIESLWD